MKTAELPHAPEHHRPAPKVDHNPEAKRLSFNVIERLMLKNQLVTMAALHHLVGLHGGHIPWAQGPRNDLDDAIKVTRAMLGEEPMPASDGTVE